MKKRKIVLLVLGSIIFPFLVYSIPLFFTNGFTGLNRPELDIIVNISFSVSILTSSFFIFELPINKVWKIVLSVIYCPILVYLLFFFSFLFVTVVFGRSL